MYPRHVAGRIGACCARIQASHGIAATMWAGQDETAAGSHKGAHTVYYPI